MGQIKSPARSGQITLPRWGFVLCAMLSSALLPAVCGQDTVRYTYQVPLQIDSSTKRVFFDEVVPVKGVTQSELYSRAREWFVTTFNSADDVLQMEDKESGKLLGKAWSDIYIYSLDIPVKVKIWYVVKVYVKDDRYKVVLTDIDYQAYPSQYNLNPPRNNCEYTIVDGLYKSNGKPKNIASQYKEQTIFEHRKLFAALRAAMDKPASNGDTDW